MKNCIILFLSGATFMSLFALAWQKDSVSKLRLEAIDRGLAEWKVVDKQTGRVEFSWIAGKAPVAEEREPGFNWDGKTDKRPKGDRLR